MRAQQQQGTQRVAEIDAQQLRQQAQAQAREQSQQARHAGPHLA
jgi:hypothetical protein